MNSVKKIAIVLGSLIALFIAVAIIVPLVVNVDQYRPQAVEAANKKINGKLELGKLSLSLWGQIRIQVEGFRLADAQGREVVSVKDAWFHLPFTSILSGSPIMTFTMDKPVVNVVKQKDGKLNVMKLVKEDAAADAKAGAEAAAAAKGEQPPGAGGGEVKLPGLASRARFGAAIRDALLTYKDETTGESTEVKDLNLRVKDLSLSRPSEVELWADLDTKMKGMTLKGPAKAEARTELTLSGNKIEQVALTFKAVADDVVISMPGTFEKAAGIPANLEGAIKTSARELKIEKMDLKFHNAVISTTGTVTNTSAEAGSSPAPTSGVVRMQIDSNDIKLNEWNALIPPLKEYELGGAAGLHFKIEGPSDKIGYSGSLEIKSLTMKAGKLKTQPVFAAAVQIETDRIENFFLTMTAPANQLRIQGKLLSFTAPRMNMSVTSTGMDLDQLIEFPPPEKAAAAPADSGAAPGAGGGSGNGGEAKTAKGAPTENFDAMLDPMRANPMMAAFVGNIDVEMKMIQAKGVRMTDIRSKMTMRDLTAAIESFGMKVFDGSIHAKASVAMKPKTPTYRFDLAVNGLDLQKAVTSQMQLFKNTLIGKADFKMDGTGSSFNPDPAKMNLNAKGSLKVGDAKFATIDAGKMATEAVNKALEKIQEKIPAAKGKSVKSLPAGSSKYEWVSSDFTITGGKFSAPNFKTKAAPNAGIDLEGTTTVGLVDLSLNTRWVLVDTFNMTKAKDISVNFQGVDVPHLLAEGDGPVKFPVSAGCTVTTPCYSYTQVPEYLASVALKNTTGAATGKAKSEAKKRGEELLKNATKSAPAPVQNAIQGLGKKLFGR